jgi:YebC/PmpR family DNA-binding regulatory protein
MSGHSKWSTIKRQKAVTDQKRGQIFTKLAQAITVAVRDGGGPDPDSNFKLRIAIDKARAANMPKDNITRAIDRGSGKGEGSALEEITYEAFAQGGSALLIHSTTDNRQRAAQEIRQIVTRCGGTLGSSGSVSYLFQPAGFIFLPDQKGDNLVLQIMDIPGVNDVDQIDDGIEIITQPELLSQVRQSLSEQGFSATQVELIQTPKTLVPLSDSDREKITNMLSKLEDSSEVQAVFSNADL